MIETTRNIGHIVQKINERVPFAPQVIEIEATPAISGIGKCLIKSREAGIWHSEQLNLNTSSNPRWLLNQLRTYKGLPYGISEVREVNNVYYVTLSPK